MDGEDRNRREKRKDEGREGKELEMNLCYF